MVGSERSGPECGTWVAESFCEGGHVQPAHEQYCERRECPEDQCSGEYVRTNQATVTERVMAARMLAEETTAKRTMHVVIRPESEVTVDEFYDQRPEIKDALMDRGARGAVLLGVHPYTATEKAKELARGDDRDPVKYMYEEHENYELYLDWDPHMHGLIVMDPESRSEGGQGGHLDLGGDDDFDISNPRRTEGLARVGGYGDERAIEDVASVVGYTLRKAMWDGDADVNRDLVTYYGDLHPFNLDTEEDVPEESRESLVTTIEKVTGSMPRGVEPEDEEQTGTCEIDGCEEPVHHISKAPKVKKDHRWDWTKEQLKRIMALYQWLMEDEEPQPGLKHPGSPEEFEEALDSVYRSMVNDVRDGTGPKPPGVRDDQKIMDSMV